MTDAQNPAAPGTLELVRRFVNTRDLDLGTDALAEEAGWLAWNRTDPAASGLGVRGGATATELARLRDLREALRAALVAHHDRVPVPAETVRALDAALAWSAPTAGFGEAGLVLRPAGKGARELAGAVLAAVADGLAEGTFGRLKACGRDTCRWAFYDRSRSRTGLWCSMSGCGNQAKQERWRARN